MTRIAAALIVSIVVGAGAAAALEQDFLGGRREPLRRGCMCTPLDTAGSRSCG